MIEAKVSKIVTIQITATGKDEEDLESEVEDKITKILEEEFPGKDDLHCQTTEWIWNFNKLESDEWKVTAYEEWSE